MARKLLLACGILASLLYVGMNAFVPALFETYSMASQTVSELSAVGAPTRRLWVGLGTVFRLYSVATLVLLLVFGALTGLEGPKISANLPTPRIGVWERISIAAFLVWVVALAIKLLSSPRGAESAAGEANTSAGRRRRPATSTPQSPSR